MTSDDHCLDETQQHLSQRGRIDHLCDRFETLWRTGKAPSIDEFLTGWDEPERTHLEEELKRIQHELERGEQSTLSTDARKGQFGDYELLEEVARGGMGVVYKARQISLNRIVALKMILSGQFACKEDVQRFHSEAEAAARLDHSGIVPIYEVGKQDGLHYFSMGFVEGQSLTAKLKEGPLSPREAAQLTQKVAEAIAHAHQHGVIHRDLKPSNILLARSDRIHAVSSTSPDESGHYEPKVTDFGLAKQVDSGDHLTTTGQVLGTASYMPPEQAAGKANAIEPTADVYGLGAVLYCTLTGRPPFQSARVMDTLMQVVHQEPVSPRLLNSKVTRDLETICLKCLEKDPKRRYQTATELADELRRWLAGEPIQARPTSTSEQIVKWTKRRPAVAGLLLVGLLAIVASVGAIVGASYNARLHDSNVRLQESLNETEQAKQVAEESRQMAEQAKEVADQARQAAEEANRRAEVADYFRRIALARAEWQDGNIGQVEPLLNGCPEKYRQWEWHYLKRLCHNDLLTFKGHGVAVLSVDFSPDGKRLASGAGREVKIWDATTGKIVLAMEGHTEPVYRVTFSPDGKRLASAGDKTVKVWDADTGEEIITLTGHAKQIRGLAFSADGGRLASAGGSYGGELKIWDSTTGQQLRSFDWSQPSGDCISVAFSPDGQWLAAGGGQRDTDGQVTIWDAKDFRQVHVLKGHTLPVLAVAFSPEGDRIASASADQTVKVWDVMTGTEILTIKHRHGVTGVAYSPEGKRIASSDGQTVKVWDAMNGQEILELKGHGAGVLDVAFSPDGKRLASGSIDTTVKVWDTTGQRNQQILKGHPDSVSSVAFSPNGKQIASSSGGRWNTPGEVRIWDAMTGRLALTIQGDPEGVKGHAHGVESVAFSPDGNWLASASFDRTVKVWDAKTGKLLRDLKGQHTNGIFCIAYSPDGRHLASASHDETVVVWDTTTGDKVHTLTGHTGEIRCVAFSPDGRRIASAGGEKTVRLWNTMTGKEVLKFASRSGAVWCAAFSPDGRWLALGDSGGSIVVFDAASGAKVMAFYGLGHMGSVRSVAFSPEGKRLASGSSDQTVRIWDLTTRQEALTLRGHTGGVRSVAFSPDGWRLASASQDRTVRIWDATPLSP